VSLTKTEEKYLTSLNNKKGRRKENRFLAEGVRLLEEALKADYLPLSIMYAPSELNPRGEKLVNGFTRRKVSARSISARSWSSRGTCASFDGGRPISRFAMARISSASRLRWLLLTSSGSPGNSLLSSTILYDHSLYQGVKR